MKGRVLHIFNRYLQCGGEELAVERIDRDLALDWEVQRCFFDSAEWVGDQAPPKWKQALWMIHNPEARQRVAEAHAAFGADLWLVHNVHPVASAGIFAEAKKLHVPVLHMLHNYKPFALVDGGAGADLDLRRRYGNFRREIAAGAWQNSRLKTAWHALAVEIAHQMGWYRSIARWLAISPSQRDAFAAAGVPEQRLQVLPHAWQPGGEENGQWRTPEAESDDMDYYLFLGRLTEAKGVRTLLETWKQLGMSAAPKLVIAGAGELADEVREVAGRNPQITFAGYVEAKEKAELLRNCRALVAPSIWPEPLGLVAYEAYEYGKPVIATAGGGFSHSVEDRKTGRLFTAGDAPMLAAIVRDLERADRSVREEMGRAGLLWLQQEASVDQWRQRFAAIAEPLVRRQRKEQKVEPDTEPS